MLRRHIIKRDGKGSRLVAREAYLEPKADLKTNLHAEVEDTADLDAEADLQG